MSNQNTTVALSKFSALDKLAESSRMQVEAAKGDIEQAGALALGIQVLRDAIPDDVLSVLMGLQNTPLGFVTDNQAGYPKDVVRDCFIEATLRGVKTAGNEFNIIQRRMYITKNGYQGKLARLHGFTDLEEDYGVPAMKDGGAIVHCKASWKMHGQPAKQEADIPVRVNQGMGIDAILGKAQRKFLKRVFERATGKREPDDDGDVAEIKPANVTNVETSRPNFGNPEKGLNV